MRVLLTGSAGFVGGAVAAQLEAQGDEVVRVDLLIPEAHAPGRYRLGDVRHVVAAREGAPRARAHRRCPPRRRVAGATAPLR